MVVKLEDGKSFKVGVGITTYNRFDRFKECFESLIANARDVDEILIVEDCSEVDKERYDKYFEGLLFNNIRILRNKTNKGVGFSKNKIMEYFYSRNYDYFFTLEDDQKIKSPEIFKTYVEASVKSGYHYLNFAEHGPHNKTFYVKDVNGYNLRFYPNIVGAFTLYSKELIEKVGYHDEQFINAVEHVEYTYRASLVGMTSKFWHFADVTTNTELIEEQKDSLTFSSIRSQPNFQKNCNVAWVLFFEKHGVWINDIPR